MKFDISVAPSFQQGSTVRLIVSNGGYEALKHNCLRGKSEETEIHYKANNKYYYRYETTSYYGNHCVQAYVKTSSGKTYYSDVLVVKVRWLTKIIITIGGNGGILNTIFLLYMGWCY